MTLFWIITGALSVVVAVLLALALLRGQRDTGPAQAFDVQVYRDQLKEVERDLERRVISGEDAERIRTEISRRLLSADAKAQQGGAESTQPLRIGQIAAGLMTMVLIGGGFGIYTQLGAPGYGDLGLKQRIAAAADLRANRPSQAEAESTVPPQLPPQGAEEYTSLVERLRTMLQDRPDDLRGWTLLARSEAGLGNFSAAYGAQQRVVALKGDQATGRDFADMADMMILAAGGYVSPEAEAALEQALQREPRNPVARYYGGLMMSQTGRPDVAFRMWRELLAEGPGDAPWIPPIRDQIEEIAFRAGQHNFTLPPLPEADAPGPTREDIEAAQEMSAEDRAEMIRGMVAGLADRLATQGGPPGDWARLIGAYGVLGETDAARAIWQEAQSTFAGAEDALAVIRQAAEQAGVAE